MITRHHCVCLSLHIFSRGCVAVWLRSCVVVRCVAVECLFLEPLWTSVFSLCACLSYVSLMSSREHQPWMAWLCWRPLSTNLSGVTPIAPFCSSRRTFMNYSAAICSRRRICSSSRSLCVLCSIIFFFKSAQCLTSPYFDRISKRYSCEL